jgi:putative peptide zinc metalloprotease protein
MRFPPEALVIVNATVRQLDGEETILGRSDTGVFLVIPTEALELLDELAAGKTVGETGKIFQERHGDLPDMEDFLCALEERGLVELWTSERPTRGPEPRRFHFAKFPETLARKIFGPASIILSASLIVIALIMLGVDRSVLPNRNALYFQQNLTLTTVLVFSVHHAALLVHEMAHLVAARAVGVSSRLSIGHRLWILVAQADMSGLWAVPREKRYLPLLAGPLVDAASSALLVILLFGSRHGWWTISTTAEAMISAILFIYILSLLWQCFFFVRTDLYYVLSNYFGCKNLMGDTEALLRIWLGRLLPLLPYRDPLQIPERELRVVKVYTGIWLLGRALAFAALVFIYIPLMWHYIITIARTLAAGYGADQYAFVDALVTTVIVITPMIAGWWLWLRSLVGPHRKRPLNAT